MSDIDLLTTLPAAIRAHISGERRRHLLEYLLRWDEHNAALVCLDGWLETQPHLVMLREARARVLLEQGRAPETLVLLDELDAERPMSESRRALRIQALAARGRWEDAHALLANRPDDAAVWRQRADLLRQQGRFDEAAAALVRVAELLPDGSDPLYSLAELALARGEPQRVLALLQQRRTRFPDAPQPTRELRLAHRAVATLDDRSALAASEKLLRERRATERDAIIAELDLDSFEDEASPKPSAAPVHPLAPSPAQMSADEPTLPLDVYDALHTHFGYRTFRPGQAEVIARVLRGESVLAILPTGAGKSLTYQLPALLLPGATLVISPLIALMKDQIDGLPPALAERATTINSALSGSEVAARLRGVREGRYKLIYVAPERLRGQPFIQALRKAGISRVVVDEAHCVSLWGVSFRPDYLFIGRAIATLGNPALLALTATATPATETEIKSHLGAMPTVRTSVFRHNLRFEVARVANKDEKLDAIATLCEQIGGAIAIYARSRDSCEQIAWYLRKRGIAAEHYHAQIEDRAAVQERFMRGETRVLAATVAFGMGIDKPDIRAIIHYNLPQSVEAYYQEAGRAGRDGQPARCILLYASADKGQMTAWLREEALTKDGLRQVYGKLRQRVDGRWGVVAFDDLRRDLRENDETRLRVGLGLLERVGLLARHFDLPRAATLTLRDAMCADDMFERLVQSAEIRLGQPVDVDLLALSAALDCAPDELERCLLDWHSAGLLRYDGVSRDLLLEMLPPPANVGAQIDALLSQYAAEQDGRVDAIADYARALRCRHRTIAAHFGERMAACGDACDICASERPTPNDRRPTTSQRRASSAYVPPAVGGGPSSVVATAILDAVQELPGQLNDKDLANVLLGTPGFPTCAAYGRLAGGDFLALRTAIAALVSAGKLAYRNRALVPATQRSAPPHASELSTIALQCFAHLPFPVGRSGLAKVLKGAAGSPVGPERCPEHGALRHLTGSAIEALINDLIAQGYFTKQENGIRPLLTLSERGAELVREHEGERVSG